MVGSFPTPADGPVVVVGAGTSGAVVARRLVDAGYQVVLVEAGPVELPSSEPALTSVDHLAAQGVTSRWWSDVTARRTDVAAASPYRQGRGLGGSSAVNGLMAEWDPADPAFDFVPAADAARSRVLLSTERVGPAELGVVNRAVLDSDGGRTVELARRDGRRSDAASDYLGPLIDRSQGRHPRLEPIGDTAVDRIELRDRPVVVAASGARFDAAAVVLCAGALQTPAILLRSGVSTGVGVHLQDHPSVVLHLSTRRRPAEAAPVAPITGALAERDGVQLLPLERLTGAGDDAALLAAVMDPAGAHGTIELGSSDPHDPPIVSFRADRSLGDLERLGTGVRRALELVEASPLADVVDAVAIDDHGTPPSVLTDDAALVDWVRRSTGAYFHAAGSCGAGRAVDVRGRLLGEAPIYVADASAFARIPRTGTHLPTIVLAEALVGSWIGTDPSDAGTVG